MAFSVLFFFFFFFIFFFFFFFFLLSYHLYRLQRHCSRAARTGIPTTSLIQGSFRIAAPPQRSTRGDVKIVGGLPPQGDIAPLPLRWCSVVPVLPVVPVLIHHTQGDTYYAPYWRWCKPSRGVTLSECPIQRADVQNLELCIITLTQTNTCDLLNYGFNLYTTRGEELAWKQVCTTSIGVFS